MRDDSYGVGAILIGLEMGFVNIDAAFYMITILMTVSGGLVYLWMEETHPTVPAHTNVERTILEN